MNMMSVRDLEVDIVAAATSIEPEVGVGIGID